MLNITTMQSKECIFLPRSHMVSSILMRFGNQLGDMNLGGLRVIHHAEHQACVHFLHHVLFGTLNLAERWICTYIS